MKNSIVNIPAYSIANLKKYGNSFLGKYGNELSKENLQFILDYFKRFGLNIRIQETYYGLKDDFTTFKTVKGCYSYVVWLL